MASSDAVLRPSTAGRAWQVAWMPAHHRDEVRGEQHLHRRSSATCAQRQLHLRGVAVGEDAVRARRSRRPRRSGSCASSARPAPETPDIASTMIPRRLDQPLGDERRERERRRGRVATGRRDVRVARDRRRGTARAARTRTGRAAPGARVRRAVPLRVVGGRQPEVGAEVHEVRDRVDELRRELLRLAVRAARGTRGRARRARPGRTGTYSRPGYAAPSDGYSAPTVDARVRRRGDVHDVDVRVRRRAAGAARPPCTLSRRPRRLDTPCRIVYRLVHSPSGPPFDRRSPSATPVGPFTLAVSRAANERYWASAGVDHPALRAGALYPPIAANLTVLPSRPSSTGPLLQTAQRVVVPPAGRRRTSSSRSPGPSPSATRSAAASTRS